MRLDETKSGRTDAGVSIGRDALLRCGDCGRVLIQRRSGEQPTGSAIATLVLCVACGSRAVLCS